MANDLGKSTTLAGNRTRGAGGVDFCSGGRTTNGFYEHDQWLTIAQGASLANEWLARSGRKLTLEERKHLSAISDDMARQIAAPLSREAGLYTAHEMMESLDSNYHSELGEALMKECERALGSSLEA